MDAIRSGRWLTRERVTAGAAISAVAGVAMLLWLWLSRHGSVDLLGRPLGTDFTAFWDAGRLAIEGRAADAWDPSKLDAHITATHGVEYSTAWMYPPIFLLLIAPLAALPYLLALALWQAGSLAAVGASLRLVTRCRRSWWIIMASPLSAMVLINGQNAFVTAALLCAGLPLLDRRPQHGGALLGGLAFKPQLALVVLPLLLFTRNWRATAAATVSVAVLTVVSSAAWGETGWRAFVAGSSLARVLLETGDYGLFKSVSLFSTMRQWGAPLFLSYSVQAAGALMAIWSIWRLRCSSLQLRSAAVCAGVALLTPYLMDYDMAAVGIGAVFLYAASGDEFLPYERSALAFIWAAPWFSRPAAEYLSVPLGPLATVLLLLMTLQRARQPSPDRDIAARPFTLSASRAA